MLYDQKNIITELPLENYKHVLVFKQTLLSIQIKEIQKTFFKNWTLIFSPPENILDVFLEMWQGIKLSPEI